jgi:hypothetical protein
MWVIHTNGEELGAEDLALALLLEQLQLVVRCLSAAGLAGPTRPSRRSGFPFQVPLSAFGVRAIPSALDRLVLGPLLSIIKTRAPAG